MTVDTPIKSRGATDHEQPAPRRRLSRSRPARASVDALLTRSMIVLVVVATVALLPASPASARSSVRVGIGDQSPRMFASPDFQRLHVKRTRYFVALTSW